MIRLAVIALILAAVPASAAERGHAILFDADANWNNVTSMCFEPFNDAALMVSHETFDCGVRVRIKNLENGESVIATVTERDSSGNKAITTVTSAVAEQLGMTGRTRVMITVEDK